MPVATLTPGAAACETLAVDFCVVGGGMAGLCAAIAAARRGCRVAHAGLAIPRDVAVVGYANDRYLAPALGLTSVDQASRQIGRRALELLLQRMATPAAPAERVLLPPSLVVRRSA